MGDCRAARVLFLWQRLKNEIQGTVYTTSREVDILVTKREHKGNMSTPRQRLKFQNLLVFSRKLHGKGNTDTVLPLYMTSFVSMVIPTHSEQTFFPLSNKEVEHETFSYITDIRLGIQREGELEIFGVFFSYVIVMCLVQTL